MSYQHLNEIERGMIQALREHGVSQSAIAERLGRHKSTVSRELRRNARTSAYKAHLAQKQYRERRERCRAPKKLGYQPLWECLIDKIGRGWTPEVVAGRLPLDYPWDPCMRISHETIYQAIYKDKRLHFLIKSLPQRRPKRRKRGQGKSRRGPSIPNRTGIQARPEIADKRGRHGDWEGDLVLGSKQSGAILTLVDRKARHLKARKVLSKNADEVAQAVVDVFQDTPISWVKTITFDNGTEFAHHQEMASHLPVDIYFADPYASYQRGTNENTNGLIRRYLPKGTSFENLTQHQLDIIVEEINNRPKKCLGYRTPNEVFQEQRDLHRVALGS
jgi:transposase, IS30 family